MIRYISTLLFATAPFAAAVEVDLITLHGSLNNLSKKLESLKLVANTTILHEFIEKYKKHPLRLQQAKDVTIEEPELTKLAGEFNKAATALKAIPKQEREDGSNTMLYEEAHDLLKHYLQPRLLQRTKTYYTAQINDLVPTSYSVEDRLSTNFEEATKKTLQQITKALEQIPLLKEKFKNFAKALFGDDDQEKAFADSISTQHFNRAKALLEDTMKTYNTLSSIRDDLFKKLRKNADPKERTTDILMNIETQIITAMNKFIAQYKLPTLGENIFSKDSEKRWSAYFDASKGLRNSFVVPSYLRFHLNALYRYYTTLLGHIVDRLPEPPPKPRAKRRSNQNPPPVKKDGEFLYAGEYYSLKAAGDYLNKLGEGVGGFTQLDINNLPTASCDTIRKDYKALALKHHPDKGGDENTFKQISAFTEELLKELHCT